jgi:quinoprotein dehydrogenase-associated probable ABC transporter substrate-binding protein
MAMPCSPSVRIAAVLALAGATAFPFRLTAQTLRPNVEKPGIIRVCADPDNMPLSNQKGEGFEQKLAELIAKEWNAKVEYAWWPVRRGFFARALNGRYCDLAVEAPPALDIASVTRPYFRSGYVFVTRKDSGLDIKSLADPRLKKLRIGVNLLNSDAENTPPAMALSKYGVVGNLKGYSTFYTDTERPEDIVNDVAKKDIDVAIVWGPLAGYFAKRSAVPLSLQPLAERDSLSDLPFRFDIGMAVRRKDRALRDSLQKVIDRKGPEIQAILKEYGVPVFPIKADSGKKDEAKAPGTSPAKVPADSGRATSR